MKTIASIDPKAIAACFLHQARNHDVRSYLRGIYLEPAAQGGAYAVATNGHTILAVHDPSGEIDRPITLSISGPTVTKCKQKKATRFTVESVEEVLVATVQGVGFRALVEPVEGKFPNWRKVIPDNEPVALHAFPNVDSKYLANMGMSAAALAGSRYPCIRAFSTGPKSVLSFVFKSGELVGTGCIMPMHADTVAWPFSKPKRPTRKAA